MILWYVIQIEMFNLQVGEKSLKKHISQLIGFSGVLDNRSGAIISQCSFNFNKHWVKLICGVNSHASSVKAVQSGFRSTANFKTC